MANTFSQAETPVTPTELEAFSDEFMAQNMPSFHVPGAVVVIIQDDRVLLSKGYGYANLEEGVALTPTTPIRPASLAKLFTFTALLQLHEQSKFELEDTVNQHLDPPLPDSDFPSIRIYHLLTHTEGFEDRTVGIVAASAEDIQPIQSHFAATTPHRVVSPGEMISYGNYGAVLASILVEQLSEQTFEAYTTEKIFQPLDMTQTTLAQPLSEELLADLAVEYTIKGGGHEPAPLVYPHVVAGGGLTSSAGDMGKFMLMLLQKGQLEGVRLLQEETVSMMMATQFSAHPELPGTTYGFMEHIENEQRAIRRDGYGTESRSRMFLIPEQNVGIFLYYNVGENDLRDAFFSEFLDRFYPVEPTKLAPVNTTDHQTVDGDYVAVQTDQNTYGKLQMLFAGLQRVRHNDKRALTLTPLNFDAYGGIEEESHWVETSPAFYRRTDGVEGSLAFREADDTTYLFMGTGMLGAYRKLAWYETPLFLGGLTSITLLLFLATLMIGGIGLKNSLQGNIERILPLAWGLALVIAVASLAHLILLFYGVFVKGGMLPLLPAYAFSPTNFLKVTLGFSFLLIALNAVFGITVVYLWSRDVRLQVKAYLTMVSLFSFVYLWILHYWNLMSR